MAIYKPTDCSPFNGTFDIGDNSTDIPIFLECKVDTSNSVVNAYSITIFNSENEQIFPAADAKFADKVTLLADLKTYYENNYSSRGYRHLNTGLNGTYIRIPFIVNTLAAGSTVKNNQMSRSGSPLRNGRSYRWQITLYQGVETGSDKKTPVIPSNSNRTCYDMSVATGTVLGSNKKRIQTALIDSDNQVVDNLVLIDKYIKPLNLSNLQVQNWANPKVWDNKNGTVTGSGPRRVLINAYDSTYGHIYPATSEDNSFTDEQITSNITNAFQIYKNGDDPENLGTKDVVAFVVQYVNNNYSLGGANSPRNSKWEFSSDDVTPGNGFWTQEYTYDYSLDTESSFRAFGSEYPAVSDGSRVILNAFDKDSVKINNTYKGSCYNGIYYLKNAKVDGDKAYPATTAGKWGDYTFTFANDIPAPYVAYAIDDSGNAINITSSTKVSPDDRKKMTSTYYGELWGGRFYITDKTVTLYWYRAPDANTWGSLSSKIVYAQNDSNNYQSNSNVTAGSINKTPVLFVQEKPIRLFNTAEPTSQNITVGDDWQGYISVGDKISTVTSVTITTETATETATSTLSPSNYSYAPGDSYIYIYTDSKPESVTVNFTPYSENDYTGLIFYNDTVSATKRVYIRPSAAIKSDMLLVAANNPTQAVNITNYNSAYSYVEYTESWDDVKSDETRYQIKSFYKESDLNSFSFYSDPTITIECKNEANKIVDPSSKLDTRNFTATATYNPGSGNYIYWRSYYWTLSLNGQVLSVTPEIYAGEITANFYGLERGNTYTLTLTLVINTGKIITVAREIPVEFEEIAQAIAINAGFECDTLSLSAQQLEAIKPVVVPEADYYDDKFENGKITMNAEPDSDGNFIWQIVDDVKMPIASIKNGALVVDSGNQVKYSKAAALPEIVNGAVVDLELNDDAEYFTVECQHTLSGAYEDELFSLTAGNNTVSIFAPLFREKTQDGFILSENRNKIMISRNSGNATGIKDANEIEDLPVLPNWLPSTENVPKKAIVSDVAQITFENSSIARMSWQAPLAGRKNHPLILWEAIGGNPNYQIDFYVQDGEQPQNGESLRVCGDTAAMWGDYDENYTGKVAGTEVDAWGAGNFDWVWNDEDAGLVWYDGEAFGIDDTANPKETKNSYHSSLVSQVYHNSQYPNRNKTFTFKLTFDRELNLLGNNSTYYISD